MPFRTFEEPFGSAPRTLRRRSSHQTSQALATAGQVGVPGLRRGKFVIKELEALYFLRKYRALKQRYYEEDS
ncbi:hypothetical protein E2320_004336 [Naja naja]|nr:hypothetical protein E2320_004336 [Naja naja]